MRLMADANMDAPVIERLRAVGHDVLYAGELSPSPNDLTVLQQATREKRTLFTYDTDFGDLVHLHGEPAPYGVILFRLPDDVQSEARVNFILGTVTMWELWSPGIWTIQIRHRPV